MKNLLKIHQMIFATTVILATISLFCLQTLSASEPTQTEETAPPLSPIANLIAPPTLLGSKLIKYQGKEVISIATFAYPNGNFRFESTPLPNIKIKNATGTITCNGGVTTLTFDVTRPYSVVLNGCNDKKKIDIKIN